jgi:arylsulfatase A-like enzyme
LPLLPNEPSQLKPTLLSKTCAQISGRGILAIYLGAAVIALLQSLFWSQVDHHWAEELVLVWVGASVWVTPLAALICLFGNLGPLQKLCGASGSTQRKIRSFLFAALAATPPIWGMLHAVMELGWISQTAFSLTMPVIVLPAVLFLPSHSSQAAKFIHWSGLGAAAAILAAIYTGPISNWLDYGNYPSPVLASIERSHVARASEQTPDVILLSVDTLRADAILNGENAARTPFLDRLRKEGTWADFAWSPSNRTVPGHGGMLTGLGALEHGLYLNNMRLDPSLPRISTQFQNGGYRTMGLVSNALMRSYTGFELGYDDFDDAMVRDSAREQVFMNAARRSSLLSMVVPWLWYKRLVFTGLFAQPNRYTPLPPGKSQGGVVTRRALTMMEQAYQQEQAYFFFLHYMDPHEPYAAPIGYYDKREGSGFHQRYLEEVEFIDTCVQQVVERCQKSGRPFVILFTSDHGEHFNEHGYIGHANTLHNPVLQVPFILYGSGISANQKLNDVRLDDVAPTLLGRCGITPQRMTGRNLLDPNAPVGGIHFAREDEFYGAVSGEYKWISPPGWHLSNKDAGNWYRWRTDPGEKNAISFADGPADLWSQIQTAFEQAPDPIDSSYDPQQAVRQIAIMEAMGYLETPRDL